MKTLKLFIVAIIAISVSATSFAQKHNHSNVDATTTQRTISRTETIKVSGQCESCKARIEKAAKIEGVTKTVWSDKTKLLTLVYDPNAVKTDDVQKKIAAVGHDTPKYKATDKAYNALPNCCKYR